MDIFRKRLLIFVANDEPTVDAFMSDYKSIEMGGTWKLRVSVTGFRRAAI